MSQSSLAGSHMHATYLVFVCVAAKPEHLSPRTTTSSVLQLLLLHPVFPSPLPFKVNKVMQKELLTS